MISAFCSVDRVFGLLITLLFCVFSTPDGRLFWFSPVLIWDIRRIMVAGDTSGSALSSFSRGLSSSICRGERSLFSEKVFEDELVTGGSCCRVTDNCTASVLSCEGRFALCVVIVCKNALRNISAFPFCAVVVSDGISADACSVVFEGTIDCPDCTGAVCGNIFF